jgi:hypothetical protein
LSPKHPEMIAPPQFCPICPFIPANVLGEGVARA